jgi:heme exporter protein B
MKLFFRILISSFTQGLKNKSEIIVSIGFIFAFCTIAALGMGAEAFARAENGVGLLWLAALLTLTLATPNFATREEEQGILLQWQLLPIHTGAMLFARACGLFLAVFLPLLLTSPFIGIAFNLSTTILVQTLGFLALGCWGYWLINTSASLLLLGSARAGGLQLLLTLPLGVPLLVFGCGASLSAGNTLENAWQLLAAAALAITALSPWLMNILLRMYRSA